MVEWKKLVSISNVQYGYPFESSLFSEDSDKIPLIRIRDVKPAKASTYYSGEILKDYIIRKGDILVGMDGEFNLGKWNDREGLLNQRVLKLTGKRNICLDGYLFHYMGPVFKKIEKQTAGGSVKHLSAKIINAIEIPVPSLAEQSRIVSILDTFTASIDNLKQQIEQRRKQYEYYRDQLLDLEGKEGVEMKKLGNVLVSLKTGLNPRKNFVLNSPGSKNFYITVRELGHYNITPTDKTDLVTDEALRLINNRSNLEKGDVLFSGTGTIGRTALVKEKPNNWNIKEGVYTLKPIQSVISSKFLIELLHTNPIMDKINSFIVGDPIRSVPMKSLVLVSIPIPSLEEQSRIVGILDTFEASIANLEQQLEMRVKLYEYYRNKLLDFE